MPCAPLEFDKCLRWRQRDRWNGWHCCGADNRPIHSFLSSCGSGMRLFRQACRRLSDECSSLPLQSGATAMWIVHRQPESRALPACGTGDHVAEVFVVNGALRRYRHLQRIQLVRLLSVWRGLQVAWWCLSFLATGDQSWLTPAKQATLNPNTDYGIIGLGLKQTGIDNDVQSIAQFVASGKKLTSWQDIGDNLLPPTSTRGMTRG
ncbi:hypothetical protein BgramDRAFT_5094 [Paraburkholderia graminis C4D1M]|uniref:Uncharacterized protein n=1 Tax=Paraburkholderia graminis (strain ATCC 700544 / DSM 17151 / LMG 18924 / NCIMB 13744 / C4D1M) TaxID=396598 RepID=B1G6U8_PARG4|nr:hypothetical protein BgramDRAFT_5094 [Paraburkholderia graminis C4D1M]